MRKFENLFEDNDVVYGKADGQYFYYYWHCVNFTSIDTYGLDDDDREGGMIDITPFTTRSITWKSDAVEMLSFMSELREAFEAQTGRKFSPDFWGLSRNGLEEMLFPLIFDGDMGNIKKALNYMSELSFDDLVKQILTKAC